jgi:hypothetical protein
MRAQVPVGLFMQTPSLLPLVPSKTGVAFSERLVGQALKKVPHRQWVFAIPKRLRIYFLFDRKLLAELSRCV